jgi:hypothetical protein
VRTLWLAARLATHALRAENLASLSRTDAALRTLVQAYALVGEQMPARRCPVELNILLAQVCISERRGPLALAAAEMALAQLSEGRGRYEAATRAYLSAFCRALVNYCLAWRDGDSFIPAANDAFSTEDLEKVSRRVRERFVLPPDGRFI